MSRIAYIRVSTNVQSTDRQEEVMKNQNIDKYFVEKISGKDTDRPQFKKMMEYIREGDTVIVESYSRLARNTRDLIEIVDQFNKKGVNFISIKEKVDTSTPQGKLMFHIYASLAEYEREQILQRQAEGIAIAKEKGLYKGRKKIEVDTARLKIEVQAVREHKQTHEQAMKILGLKPNTYYRRIKELGL